MLGTDIDRTFPGMWPVPLRPLPDELLTSWLVRLARAHGLRLHTFCSLYWPRKQMWNRDLDRFADSDVIAVLAEHTGIPYSDAYDTMLRSWEHVIFEKCQTRTNSDWILPVGIYHRIRRRHGLQYCPECLGENGLPYFRKSWRLAFVTCCTKHRLRLSDSCPHCGKPVVFHRVNQHQSLAQCPFCDGYLTSRIAPTTCDELTLTWANCQQRVLESVLRIGYAEVDGEAVRTQDYFAGLGHLCRLLAHRDLRSQRLRLAISDECGLDLPAIPSREHRSLIRFEDLRCDNRAKILSLAGWLLSDFPRRLARLLEVSHCPDSYWLKHRDLSLPKWISTSVTEIRRR
ncbi:MAG: TniQ family protein [Gammaproteobacteria bacterium]|nr:TniQ family protein [Gammaproteobacteria bacterium]MCP5136354.1 TniQ family protein [Gammaproteobacteria bacterium]